MNIKIEQVQGSTAIAVIRLEGELDGSNYQDLIARGRDLVRAGSSRLVLDMSELSYISSAGLVALHNIALLAQGKQAPDPENGWGALRAMAQDAERTQGFVKLVNVQAQVDRALDMTGMKQFFEIFGDLNAALAAFGSI